MALKSSGFSSKALAGFDHLGPSGAGHLSWSRRYGIFFGTHQLNPSTTYRRVTLDADPFSVSAQELLPTQATGVDESGNTYAIHGTAGGSAPKRLVRVDPFSGANLQVFATTGPASNTLNSRGFIILSTLGRIIWIPDYDAYGLGGDYFLCVADYTTAGWPLISSVALPSQLASSSWWMAYKDANSIYVGRTNGGTSIFQYRLSDLTIQASATAPLVMMLGAYDNVADKFTVLVEDGAAGATDGFLQFLTSLDEITSASITALNPRFGGGTFVSVQVYNSTGVSQRNRLITASLTPGAGNAAVMGTLESTVETTGSEGMATFRYNSPLTLTEPNPRDTFNISVET